MPGQDRRQPDWGPPGKMVTDGMRAGVDRIISDGAKPMLRETPKATRFVLKQVPGAPGFVYDVVEGAQSKDRLRKLAGVTGSFVGGAAGGALGAATGPAAPVAAPLGAAVGSVAGEHIAEEFYDDHEAAIRRTLSGTQADIIEGLARTKAWMKGREDDVARATYAPFERVTRATLRR